MADTSSVARISAPKAALITAAVVVVVALLIGAYYLLNIQPLFAGFLFALYWAAIKHSDFKEFAPSLVGALGGLALAAGLHYLPQLYGNAGMAAALAIVIWAIYTQIRNSLPLLVNAAFMLYLTVGTIPAVGAQEDYLGMAFAVVVSAAYCGGLIWLIGRLGTAKAQTADPQTDANAG